MNPAAAIAIALLLCGLVFAVIAWRDPIGRRRVLDYLWERPELIPVLFALVVALIGCALAIWSTR
jgi:hypothetical protein